MPIDTQTGAVFNEEDREKYEAKKARGEIAAPPKGKVRKADGTEEDL